MTVFKHYAAPHRMSILSRPSTRQLSRKVPADAGCLCDKVAVLRERIKETLCLVCVRIVSTPAAVSACVCDIWHSCAITECRLHTTLHLSGSVNKPHVSGGVEFAARIVVTVFRHSWRQENLVYRQDEVWSIGKEWWISGNKYMKTERGIMYVWKKEK